jgi:hypothetical protein
LKSNDPSLEKRLIKFGFQDATKLKPRLSLKACLRLHCYPLYENVSNEQPSTIQFFGIRILVLV